MWWRWLRSRRNPKEIDQCKEIVNRADTETQKFCRETAATDGLLVKRSMRGEIPLVVVIGFGRHYATELERLVTTMQENEPFRPSDSSSTPLDDLPPQERP